MDPDSLVRGADPDPHQNVMDPQNNVLKGKDPDVERSEKGWNLLGEQNTSSLRSGDQLNIQV